MRKNKKGIHMNAYEHMKIATPQQIFSQIENFKQYYSKFSITAIEVCDYKFIHQSQGCRKAEMLIASIYAQLSLLIPNSKQIIRSGLSTLFFIRSACDKNTSINILDENKNILKKLFKKEDSYLFSTVIYPEHGKDSNNLIKRLWTAMPIQWLPVEKQAFYDVDFKKEFNCGNIHIYAQGIYFTDNSLRGAELLVRWQKQDGSIAGPYEFLDTLISQGLAPQLFDLLLSEAELLHQELANNGLSSIISINIHPINLVCPEYLKILQDHCLNKLPDYIELELIESDDFSKITNLQSSVEEIHRLGYRISIDDFGCSYAWINTLDNHVDTVKLDRSLTQRISKGNTSEIASCVIESIACLAKSKQVHVIAEGVENENDYQKMINLGVTAVQGYYFNKPMPITNFINECVVKKIIKPIMKQIAIH